MNTTTELNMQELFFEVTHGTLVTFDEHESYVNNKIWLYFVVGRISGAVCLTQPILKVAELGKPLKIINTIKDKSLCVYEYLSSLGNEFIEYYHQLHRNDDYPDGYDSNLPF